MKIRMVEDSKEKIQIALITLWSWTISWHQEKKMHTYLVKTLNKRKNVCVNVTMLIITVIKLAISSSIGLWIINEKLCKTTCKIMSIDCMMRVLVVTKSTNVCIPNRQVYGTSVNFGYCRPVLLVRQKISDVVLSLIQHLFVVSFLFVFNNLIHPRSPFIHNSNMSLKSSSIEKKIF